MATALPAGQFLQIPLPAGSVLLIGGRSSVRVVPPFPVYMGGGPWIVSEAEDRVGPFPASVMLNIQAGGSGATYSVLSPSDEVSLTLAGSRSPALTGDGNFQTDGANKTLLTADNFYSRGPSTTLTYSIDAATAWPVGSNVKFFLPTSGTVSFAVSGGPTLNGATTTLTRTFAANTLGSVVLSRVQGTSAYTLTGA